jgi:hypothetical protein
LEVLVRALRAGSFGLYLRVDLNLFRTDCRLDLIEERA